MQRTKQLRVFPAPGPAIELGNDSDAGAYGVGDGTDPGAERGGGGGAGPRGAEYENVAGAPGMAGESPTRKTRDATRRRLDRIQAATLAVEAMTFNLSYERENNTPSYDRLRIAPLRLGSGLAASALPVSTALAPAPCASPTHGSVAEAEMPPSSSSLAGGGAAVGLQALLSVASPTGRLAHGAGSGTAASSGAVGRPLKRQRVDGGTSGAGGDFVTGELTFVLSR